jgi:uncharacterized protein YndB with AHSA1/START domain
MTRIERQVVVRAPRSRVWKVLTTTPDFCKWFGVETAEEFRAGAKLRMKSTHPGSEGEFTIEIAEMTPESRFAWRWRVSAFPDPGLDEPATLVVFELSEVPEGTLVKVTESGFECISLTRRAKAFQDNEKGWDHQMQSIRKYAEEGA